MASLESLVEKVLYEPHRCDFGDVKCLLEEFGYTLRKSRGSERIFHKKGAYPINVPTVGGKQVKLPYIRRLVRLLELEEWYENYKGA